MSGGRRAPRLPYMPGVDGLRALAVAAVVAYHAGASWLPGGFLGVDVFLVISGYLITSLLLAEREATGRIDLVRFWIRRARRLLPAVVVMIVAVLAVMAVLHPDEVGRLRGAVVASLLYVVNWYQVFAEQSYFAQYARPSVFQHLWSLAVEEQFYLLWPPILAAGLLFLRRRILVWVVLAGIAASTALAWVLYEPFADPSRIYYGTDTRAAGLLVGVVLAFLWPAARLRPSADPRVPNRLDIGGGLGLAALAAVMLTIGEFDRALYQGGFLVVAVVTAVVLAVVAHPSSRIARFFALAPLVWIGVRSYGIYLWHWPVIMLTRPGEDVPFDGPPLVVLQLGLTVALAAVSYRWVEQPIRRNGLAPLRGLVTRSGGARRRVRLGAGAVAVATCALIAFVALVPAQTPSIPGIPASAAETPTGATSPATSPAARPAPRDVSRELPKGPVLAVGDSVMLGASEALGRRFGRRILVDASVGRQFTDAMGVVASGVKRRKPGVVVVHLGNNGYVPFEDLETMLDGLRGVPVVVLVNVRVDKRWQDSVNDALRFSAGRRRNVVVADWYTRSADHPEWLVDGAHVNAEGARAYSQLILDAIRLARA